MRLADQIDCTEDQLQELKDAFDRAKTGNQIDAVSFFLQTRKYPKLKAMANAVARDPEGCSRIAKETFAQVWDRMESDLRGKMFGWPTIVEYFTKRGHPLSKEDMLRLQQEDQRIQEQQAEEKRLLEIENAKKMQKLMEAVEQEETFEQYEARMNLLNG